jgi:hypothetical protein
VARRFALEKHSAGTTRFKQPISQSKPLFE